MAAKRLTDKQRRLVSEYAIDRNVRAAALRAGYSTHTARRVGELVSNPKVRAEMNKIDADALMIEMERKFFYHDEAQSILDACDAKIRCEKPK